MIRLILLLTLTSSLSHLAVCQSAKLEDKVLINGITLGMHSFDYSLDYSPMVEEIAALGSEWIQVNVKFFQENIYSSRIVTGAGYEKYWNQFEQIIHKAKEENLKVSILPIVLLSNAHGSNWRGMLEPYDVDKWFRYYEKIIIRIANIAETQDVEMMSVGSELVSLQQYQSHWTRIITNTRTIFKGKLNYAANWDAYADIGFLDKLDYLGLSGYYNLTDSTNPTKWSLCNSWNYIKREILAFQELHDIPIIFTELGYTSQDGTNMQPWNYYATDKVDLEEQKLCYQAFIEVWGRDERFHGVFFYDWFAEGGPTDVGYTIKDKPAEAVVKAWFEQIKR